MFRKLTFITLALTLAIGISSASFTESQPKPTKKAAKKTKAKKPKEDDKTPAAATANTEKLTWYSMTDGFAKAKKEKKVLVVDVYTDWCYW